MTNDVSPREPYFTVEHSTDNNTAAIGLEIAARLRSHNHAALVAVDQGWSRRHAPSHPLSVAELQAALHRKPNAPPDTLEIQSASDCALLAEPMTAEAR